MSEQEVIGSLKAWSSTHVRLRAELLVTSVLLLALSRLNLSLDKIPIVGADIDGDLAPAPIAIALFLLWLFFLIALLVRSSVENTETIEPIAQLKKLEIDLSSLVARNEGMASTYVGQVAPAASALNESISEYESWLQNISRVALPLHGAGQMAGLRAVPMSDLDSKSAIDDIIRSSPLYSQLAHGDAGDMFQRIDELKFRVSGAVTTIETMQTNILAAMVEDKWRVELSARQIDLSEKVRSGIDELQAHWNVLAKENKKTSDHLQNGWRAVRRALGRTFFMRSIDRDWLGLWVPVALALAIVAFSAPQLYLDISLWMSNDVVPAVLRWDTDSLFFRPPMPTPLPPAR